MQGTRRFFRIELVLALLFAHAIMVAGMPVRAATDGSLRDGVVLLLIEDPGCPWCARWDAEVREAYVNSPEGKFARFERRRRGTADVAFVAGVAYSPTFVVLKDGKEVGRILGYPGADFFWSLLAELLDRAGFKDAGHPTKGRS